MERFYRHGEKARTSRGGAQPYDSRRQAEGPEAEGNQVVTRNAPSGGAVRPPALRQPSEIKNSFVQWTKEFSCLRTSIWIFTTREIWPSGRRHFCAIQAFCRRQNLSAGGIHSRRACKIHCGIHKKDAGAKLYFTAVSEFQDITRNWVLD